MGLILFSLTIAASLKERPDLVLTAVILGAWTFSLIYIVEFLTSYIAAFIVDGKIDFRLLFPHFGNIRFFNQFQIWLIPIVLAPLVMLKINNRATCFSLYLISGLWITILITSQSRGAQLAVILALIITIGVYGPASRRLLKVSMTTIGIGISFYLLLFKLIPNFISFLLEKNIASTNLVRVVDKSESSVVRLQLLKQSFTHILENPIFGIGPMHTAYYPGQHAHPHNSLLQICSEFGIPFCLLSAGLLAIFIWRWIRFSKISKKSNTQQQTFSSIYQSKLENNQQLGIALFFSLIAGLIYSLVSGVFVMPMSQTMLFITVGLMIGLLNAQGVQASSISTFKSVSLQIMVGILAIGLLLTTLPHLTTRVLHPFFATYMPEYTVGPRYWELGGLLQQPASDALFHYEHPALKNPKVDFPGQ